MSKISFTNRLIIAVVAAASFLFATAAYAQESPTYRMKTDTSTIGATTMGSSNYRLDEAGILWQTTPTGRLRTQGLAEPIPYYRATTKSVVQAPAPAPTTPVKTTAPAAPVQTTPNLQNAPNIVPAKVPGPLYPAGWQPPLKAPIIDTKRPLFSPPPQPGPTKSTTTPAINPAKNASPVLPAKGVQQRAGKAATPNAAKPSMQIQKTAPLVRAPAPSALFPKGTPAALAPLRKNIEAAKPKLSVLRWGGSLLEFTRGILGESGSAATALVILSLLVTFAVIEFRSFKKRFAEQQIGFRRRKLYPRFYVIR